MHKIVVCGEVFSTNLGDNVIHYTFSYLIKKTTFPVAIEYLDLSLRDKVGGYFYEKPVPQLLNLSKSPKSLVWSLIIRFLPREISTTLWWLLKWRSQRYKFYKIKLQGASAVFIGGGQLLADNNFDFPLKIYGVSQCAKDLHIPTFFCGCGVGSNWSKAAKYLFSKSLTNAISITVRDVESFNRLANRIPSIQTKLYADHDIAIACADAYEICKQGNSQFIGLGIASPGALRRHSRKEYQNYFTDESLLDFWINVINELLFINLPFKLFTNGAEEDQLFAEKIISCTSKLHSKPHILLPSPTDGKSLVEVISGFKAVIAFRLHACVIAYSLEIPTIGLNWDDKLKSFFQEINQDKYCFEINSVTPKILINNLIMSISDGVDISRLNFMKKETLKRVEDLMHIVDKDANLGNRPKD